MLQRFAMRWTILFLLFPVLCFAGGNISKIKAHPDLVGIWSNKNGNLAKIESNGQIYLTDCGKGRIESHLLEETDPKQINLHSVSLKIISKNRCFARGKYFCRMLTTPLEDGKTGLDFSCNQGKFNRVYFSKE